MSFVIHSESYIAVNNRVGEVLNIGPCLTLTIHTCEKNTYLWMNMTFENDITGLWLRVGWLEIKLQRWYLL